MSTVSHAVPTASHAVLTAVPTASHAMSTASHAVSLGLTACPLFPAGLRNPIDVELFTPKVDGEEIDDDVTITDKTSSSHSTQQL